MVSLIAGSSAPVGKVMGIRTSPSGRGRQVTWALVREGGGEGVNG